MQDPSSNNYQVLALKWRPQTFADVVGQEHITRTLQNTIEQNRVGHAYLFVGPRGIGKTSSARIFAKALNCEAGMNPEPCCQCRSCQEIAETRSMDVVELDGASHNGVDDIRELRDNVGYRPSHSRFKIYIIDEVHMLSNAAWNALLKTLEEPPSHVKFFFATTEPHKVLPTVVSRCQRFDLRRITVNTIVERLQHVTAAEGVPVDERALAAVARFADGGMRDALSVMDQIIAFHGGRDRTEPISEPDVVDVFGLVSTRELGVLAEAVLRNDTAEVVQCIQRLADRGRDLERLYGDLLYYVRNLMMLSVDPRDAHSLVEASDAEREDMTRIVSACRPELIPRVLEELVSSEYTLRNAMNKRVYLEALLVRLMRRVHSMQVDDLIAQINALRGTGERVEIPAAPPAPKPPPPAPAQPATPTPPPSEQPTPPTAAAAPTTPAEPPASDAPVPPPEPPPEPDPAPPAPQAATANTVPAAPVAESAVPEPDTGEPVAASPAPEPIEEPAAELEARDPSPEQYGPAAEISIPETAADALHAIIAATNSDLHLRPLKPYLQELKPVSLDGATLEIAYDDEFPEEHVKHLQSPQNWRRIEALVQRVLRDENARVLLKRWIDSVSSEERRRAQKASPEVRAQVESNTFVKQVCDLFGGHVVEVRG